MESVRVVVGGGVVRSFDIGLFDTGESVVVIDVVVGVGVWGLWVGENVGALGLRRVLTGSLCTRGTKSPCDRFGDLRKL